MTMAIHYDDAAVYQPPHPLKRASIAAGLFLAVALPILWIYTVIKEAM